MEAYQVNLIGNGGFESGLAGWSTTLNAQALGSYFGLSPNSGSGMAVMPVLATLDSALTQNVDPTGAISVELGFAINLSALDTSIFDIGSDRLIVSIGGTELYSQSLNDAFGGGATGTGWVSHAGIPVPMGLLGLGSVEFRFDVDNAPPGGDLGQFFVVLVDDVTLIATYLDADSGDPIPVSDAGCTLAFLGASVLGIARAFRARN